MSTFLESDGHYKFILGNEYPMGTYPLLPFEAGEQHGWNAVHRPQKNAGSDSSLAERQDFKAGVIRGTQDAHEMTDDSYEEPFQDRQSTAA